MKGTGVGICEGDTGLVYACVRARRDSGQRLKSL